MYSGVYSTSSSLFHLGETLMIGIFGYLLLILGFHPALILLGFVLGPRFEEHFRRAMLLSQGDLTVFVERPINAAFLTVCAVLILRKLYLRWRCRGALVPHGPVAMEG